MGTRESQIARHRANAELIGKKGKYNEEYKILYDKYLLEEMKKLVEKNKAKEEPKEEVKKEEPQKEEPQAPPKTSETENPEIATPE